MPSHIVIADASTVIGLLRIDSLFLLGNLYQSIEITSIVNNEISSELPDWISINDSYNESVFKTLVPSLDKGEASSIALALEYKDVLLIIDEKKGRRQAKEMGIRITGLVGIIIQTKKKGHINSGKEKLDALIEEGFHLSEKVYSLALSKMGEN